MKVPLEVTTLDPSWPASRVAAAILEGARRYYDNPTLIDRIHSAMDEIWVSLRNLFTREELLRIGEVTHIAIPMNNLNASITMPPSRQGYLIMFDAVLDLRLCEIFTAPRNEAAWAACYVRAAWLDRFETPYWVRPVFERFMGNNTKTYSDSYSIGAARNFIFAHECGHFFLDHLRRGLRRKLYFGGQDLAVFDPALRDEIEADRFARDVLCRSDS